MRERERTYRPSDIRHPTKLIRVRKARRARAQELFKAPPQWLVFHETVTKEKEHTLGATKVEKEWLTTLAPHFYMLEERPAKRGALSTPFLEGIKQQQRHEEPQAVAAEQGGDANEAATPPRE